MDADEEVRIGDSSSGSSPPPAFAGTPPLRVATSPPSAGTPPLRVATSPRSGSESSGREEDSDTEEQPLNAAGSGAQHGGASKRKPLKTHQIQVQYKG